MKTPQQAMLGLTGYLLLFVAALLFFLGWRSAEKMRASARWWLYAAVIVAIVALICLYLAL